MHITFTENFFITAADYRYQIDDYTNCVNDRGVDKVLIFKYIIWN